MTDKKKKKEEEEENKLEMTENDDIDVKDLYEKYQLCKSHYTKEHKRMKLLDSTDRGELWKALNAKFPPYQILPDTNFISYIKTNQLASIYTVTKGAEIQPTSEEDKDLTVNLNVALDRIWELSQIGYYQFQAGERAALLNMGITQVGWDETLTGGSQHSFYKGNVTVKNIDPIKFMRDPFATSLDTANYCMTYEIYHKNIFIQNPKYKDEYKKYKEKQEFRAAEDIPELPATERKPTGQDKDYDTLLIFWIRDGKKIHEVHTINGEHILYKKKDIKPSIFPFAELYCNEPAGSLVGVSECAKIFANNVAYNLMDSIALTAEYKNQRPPKFISSNSGLNIKSFSKHGDEADKTFVVNGDATKAVHYHQFPETSKNMPALKDSLAGGVQMVSGVDDRYTGRDTGSIITTGGTEEMLNRVTLIDTPKIMTYESYAKRLTHLILANMIQYSPKRKYFFRKPDQVKWESVEVDFPDIDNDTLFHYQINISSELPKNKQRMAEMANLLMEKQMQYKEQGEEVELITPEEWLMFQDLPNKEYMLERMGIQRETNAIEEVSQVLFEYSDLMERGVNPDDAMLATANSLEKKRKGQGPPEQPIPAAAPEGPLMGGGGGGGMMPPEEEPPPM